MRSAIPHHHERKTGLADLCYDCGEPTRILYNSYGRYLPFCTQNCWWHYHNTRSAPRRGEGRRLVNIKRAKGGVR